MKKEKHRAIQVHNFLCTCSVKISIAHVSLASKLSLFPVNISETLSRITQPAMLMKKKYHLWRMFSFVFIFPFVYERAAAHRWLGMHHGVFEDDAQANSQPTNLFWNQTYVRLVVHKSFFSIIGFIYAFQSHFEPERMKSPYETLSGFGCSTCWQQGNLVAEAERIPGLVQEELREGYGHAVSCNLLVLFVGDHFPISLNLDEAAYWAKADQD